jgi:hypothetical protein
MTTAPPGITINSAWTENGDVTSSGIVNGWVVGDFWRDVNTGQYAGSTLGDRQWFNTALEGTSNINSQIYGIQLACTNSVSQGPCSGQTIPQFAVSGIELAGTENTAPYVTGQGSLWGNRSWVWNPPGDAWPVALYSSDVSGVCSSGATAGPELLNGPPELRDTTVWQQCPNPVGWSFNVDTRSLVPNDGSFNINLSAANAAGVVGVAPAKTVWVDNDPVEVSFGTPNDTNPTVWVDHSVTADARPKAGPSGVGGMNCSVDRARSRPYTARGVAINGDGVHVVSCTAWNNAVDPQGQPNSGSNSLSVHIDEAPPSLSFEPQNSRDPTGLVVDTRDSESGVAGGAIDIVPAGSADWTGLSTSFDGAHLLARLDDAGLRGPYTIRATSCDNVGNCASTSETLTMPLRLSASSDVGFTRIGSPAQLIQERVLVDFHYKRERRHGRTVRVKTGGHYRAIGLVIRANARCGHKLVRTGPQRWREVTACRQLELHVVTTTRVPYGEPFTVHGLLITTQGVPMAGVPVSILTAPENGVSQFSLAATATTGGTGAWSATLPPGPSRIIRAVYGGSPTVLPAAGQASMSVPAKITLSVSSRTVPWTGIVVLHGHLGGGYVPTDGVALRLLIRLPGRSQPYEPIPFRTDAEGNFSIRWTWGRGFGVATYPFAIATTATESDFPFAASRSRWIPVTFGVSRGAATTRSSGRRARHHRER